jgi:serine/threonine protein phosphatase PrpC
MDSVKPLINFKIPNATVGKNYRASLEISATHAIMIIKITGLDDLGLVYDIKQQLLIGKPLIAGEHQLVIHYHHQQLTYHESLVLVINNNPKDLWKTIASDHNLIYWKADEDEQGLDGVDRWKLVAASKRGRSHTHIGSCRDDDFFLRVNRQTNWHIAAIADGAGSSDYSREGARLIVDHSSEILNQQLQHYDSQLIDYLENWQQQKTLDNERKMTEILYKIFAPAVTTSIDKLAKLAKKDHKIFQDYYSTLLLAAHKPLAKGMLSITYQIGDGALVIYKKKAQLKLLGKVDSGDYAGQTRFLDENAKKFDDIKERVKFSFDENFTALILMTDGISDPFFETNHQLKQISFWDDFWDNNIQQQLSENPRSSAKKLNNWLDFWSPGHHDDRTIALIYR